MRSRHLLHSVLVLCLLQVSLQAQSRKRAITVEDLWKVQRLGKPAISPDGQWVAVEVTSYSMGENNSTSDIWLLSTDGKTQKQLTTFKGKNSGPVWSPDSKTIAFVSKRTGDVPQVQLISREGGEAKQLTNLPMAPSGLKYGPDGKTIYCIVNTWLDTPDDESYKKREKARKDDKVQAYIIDDALFRYWDSWIADGKRPVVFAVDVESSKHKNLFAGLKLHLPIAGASAESYDISPDSKEICFTADMTKEIGTDYNLDLFTMSLDTESRERKRLEEEPKNITSDNLANDSNPAYSRQGSKIAFLRQTVKFFYADRSRIMTLDRKTRKIVEVTKELDRSCEAIAWERDENSIWFVVEDKGYHNIAACYKQDVVTMLHPGSTNLTMSKENHRLGWLRSAFDYPSQLFVARVWDASTNELAHAPPDKQGEYRIDRFNDDIVAQWDLGPVKDVTYKGADDEEVQMWIVYPPGFDAKKKWPLLMMVHGGPHNGITTDFSYRWNPHLMASKGYIVAIPNFHGSSGFGQKFTDSVTGDLTTKPFIDIMKATDYMEKQGYIDKERMAAAGGSYGGLMMAWMNGHTNRFKAMICHAGVYNWHSMMASDVVRSRERPLGALPWGDLAKIDRQSPQRFAANFKTPTLVMHGEKDYRVPVTQGFEYFSTLRLKGVPTRLVYFPDENHWILKPQNSRLWYREFFGWLEKYIGAGASE
jgi:dipeptidyl aminopeptidase/acylaminoacyl peptidase